MPDRRGGPITLRPEGGVGAPPLPGPAWKVREGDEEPASFGSLLALDGFLYAVTLDRVHCYRVTD